MSLKHAILGFLSIEPMSGYDLKKSFDQSVRHFWPADQSQIYRTLRQLDDESMVSKEVIEREGQLDVKVYGITEKGHDELIDWISTPLAPQEDREPFLIQVYFAGAISDEAFLSLVETELAGVEELLAIYEMVYQGAVGAAEARDDRRVSFFRLLTLEYAVKLYLVYRDWLTDVIARVRDGSFDHRRLDELVAHIGKYGISKKGHES